MTSIKFTEDELYLLRDVISYVLTSIPDAEEYLGTSIDEAELLDVQMKIANEYDH